MCTISISLFFENKKHVDLFLMRDALYNGSFRPNKKKTNTEADNHTRLVSSLFDDRPSNDCVYGFFPFGETFKFSHKHCHI